MSDDMRKALEAARHHINAVLVDGHSPLALAVQGRSLLKNIDAALQATPSRPVSGGAVVPKALLDERDSFIVGKGLWSEFVDTLPTGASPHERAVFVEETMTAQVAGRLLKKFAVEIPPAECAMADDNSSFCVEWNFKDGSRLWFDVETDSFRVYGNVSGKLFTTPNKATPSQAAGREEIARTLRLFRGSSLSEAQALDAILSTLSPQSRPVTAGAGLDHVRVIERLSAALTECVSVFSVVERPAFVDPQYGVEVNALGRRIGFGALMTSASASWRTALAMDGDPVGGEFVAGPCYATVMKTLAQARAALSNIDPTHSPQGGKTPNSVPDLQTDPKLLALIERARDYVMTPEEVYEQRRSFTRGMCPSDRDYKEWCEQVDRLMPPLALSRAERGVE